MRNLYKSILLGSLTVLTIGSHTAFAGNEDRIAANGANQLLINPWARSSGLAHSNMASVTGTEATFLNVAGLAFVDKTELNFTHTRYLATSGVSLNAIGFGQRVGETSVLGISVMTTSFGDIDRTTTSQPDGTAGTYNLQYGNFALSYARAFSNSIYAGVTTRVTTEGLSNARATGISFDAGIRYVTGKKEHIKFGIALKNVGGKMQFNGDGLSQVTTLDGKEFTLAVRSQDFEMPSTLNIGFSYDYYLGEEADSTGTEIKSMHRITGSGSFLSNSFGKDQFNIGAEYAFKEMFMLRAGLVYEEDLFDDSENKNIITGPTFGGTVAVPITKNGGTFDIDYSYRLTRSLGGIHSIGARINL
jgi:hypothetical protein